MRKWIAAADEERFDYQFNPDGSLRGTCRCGAERIGDEETLTLWVGVPFVLAEINRLSGRKRDTDNVLRAGERKADSGLFTSQQQWQTCREAML
jgi:hypothetical protein